MELQEKEMLQEVAERTETEEVTDTDVGTIEESEAE